HHWLTPLGVSVGFLVGSQKAAERRASLTGTQTGSLQFLIGTQALIQEQVEFQRLGLVLLDEQHRFGVEQRLALRKRAEPALPDYGRSTHQLTLCATPIPRSLAITSCADLDLCLIVELPPGRQPIHSRLVSGHRRDEVIQGTWREVQAGRQVYWV